MLVFFIISGLQEGIVYCRLVSNLSSTIKTQVFLSEIQLLA